MSERRQYVFDTMTKRDPVTEAGRKFDLLWPGGMGVIDRLEWRERILEIERQARSRETAKDALSLLGAAKAAGVHLVPTEAKAIADVLAARPPEVDAEGEGEPRDG